jgi:hypothetical protein
MTPAAVPRERKGANGQLNFLLAFRQDPLDSLMTLTDFFQSARGAFTHVFVRYGSGTDLLRPLTKTKWWNTFCWILIALGTVGWALFIFWPY